MIQMFVPSVSRPTRQQVEKEIQKVYPDSKVLSFLPKEFDPANPTVMVGEGANDFIERRKEREINRQKLNKQIQNTKDPQADKRVADIKKEVELALGLTAPKKVSPCFSVFAVNKADIISLEWWEIENTLQGLPKNVQVRVNGGSEFGRTRIDQVQNINIEIEVQPIVENIRQFVDNKSGLVFEGIIKVVPSKNACH